MRGRRRQYGGHRDADVDLEEWRGAIVEGLDDYNDADKTYVDRLSKENVEQLVSFFHSRYHQRCRLVMAARCNGSRGR